jgi:hypothetical protein
MEFGRGVLHRNLPNSVIFVKNRSVRAIFYLRRKLISNLLSISDGRNSSVDIATHYEPNGPRIETP